MALGERINDTVEWIQTKVKQTVVEWEVFPRVHHKLHITIYIVTSNMKLRVYHNYNDFKFQIQMI